jgi:hypothetical protein
MEQLSEHATAIGFLTIAFNGLEASITDVIGALLCDEVAGEIVCAPIAFSKKIDVMTALMFHKTPDIAKEVARLMAQSRILNDERNRIIHGIYWLNWFVDENTERVYMRNVRISKGRFRIDHGNITPRQIMKMAQELKNLTSELDAHRKDIESVLRCSKAKP